MPATRAAAAAKKTLSSATCETTETIRACMQPPSANDWARPAVPQPPVRNPWTRRVLCIDLRVTLASGKIRNNSSRSKKAARHSKFAVFTEPGIIRPWLSDLGQTGRKVIGRGPRLDCAVRIFHLGTLAIHNFEKWEMNTMYLLWSPITVPFRGTHDRV
jgi:hypothetical protein